MVSKPTKIHLDLLEFWDASWDHVGAVKCLRGVLEPVNGQEAPGHPPDFNSGKLIVLIMPERSSEMPEHHPDFVKKTVFIDWAGFLDFCM